MKAPERKVSGNSLLIEFSWLSREINERRAAEIRAELVDGSAG